MDLATVTESLVSVLNPDEGDIMVNEAEEAVFVDGDEAEAQAISVRIKTFLAEWFLDTDAGVPYREKIYDKSMTAPKLRDIFSAVIMERGTVERIERIDAVVSPDRSAKIKFTAVLRNGQTIEGET